MTKDYQGTKSSSQRTAKELVLNGALVSVPRAEILIGRQPYKDDAYLRSLREKHRDSHVVTRRGDTVVDIPVMASAVPLGKEENLALANDLGLCRNLVLNACMRYVLSIGRDVLHHKPLQFFDKSNLLQACVSNGLPCPQWLAIKLRYDFDVRTHYSENGVPLLFLAVAVRTGCLIETTCDQLAEVGVDLSGKYVQQVAHNSDPRLRPLRRLVGRVSGFDSKVIQLSDSRDGITEIASAEAYLEPRFENLRTCARTCFGQANDKVLCRLEEKIAAANDGPGRYQKVREVIEHLGKQILEIVPGVTISIGSVLEASKSGSTFPSTATEDRPTYVFGPSPKTNTWHDNGLDKFGPYDRTTFTPSSPKIAVICQARHRGETEQFLRKFSDGVPNVTDKNGRAPFGGGFVRKYCLDKCIFEFFESKDETPAAYKMAVGQAVEAAADRGMKWDLAFVQSREIFHQLKGDANPYLVCKAAFLAQGVPSQHVEIETMQIPDRQLVYTLNNVGLACYAKLGGIPWLLEANRGIAHELVIGLGSAIVGEARLGPHQRIVGITTVFSGDGNYILENRSKASSMEEFPHALMETLRKTIEHVRTAMNWQSGDSVRLVFHAFKPFKQEQIEAVHAVVNSLGDYDTQYAFLHIVEHHPYLLFDLSNNEGVWDAQAKTKKGRLAPTRGLRLRLSDFENLLVLTGGREVKRPSDGLPAPILVRLDRTSTFKDMNYLTRQVFQFSCHSWRSFFPSPMPITILYSELIASLLGNLSHLTQWEPQTILGSIGRTRWFL